MVVDWEKDDKKAIGQRYTHMPFFLSFFPFPPSFLLLCDHKRCFFSLHVVAVLFCARCKRYWTFLHVARWRKSHFFFLCSETRRRRRRRARGWPWRFIPTALDVILVVCAIRSKEEREKKNRPHVTVIKCRFLPSGLCKKSGAWTWMEKESALLNGPERKEERGKTTQWWPLNSS